MSQRAELPERCNYECIGVTDTLPQTFRREIWAIFDAARNGAAISPRRSPGLLIELERVKRRYDEKIKNLRNRGHAVDEAEAAVNEAAAEFVASLSFRNAA